MKKFNALKGKGLNYIIGETLLYNVVILALIFLINSYELSNILKLTFLIVNIYQIYYILMYISLYYGVDSEYIYIKSKFLFKEEKIPFSNINSYIRKSGSIKGIRLCGYGEDSFALGKTIIDKVGIAKMYCTCSKGDVIYIQISDVNFGLSPENIKNFEGILKEKGINTLKWKPQENKHVRLYKDKRFFILFIIATILILVLTLNPFILYLKERIPERIPLSFDARFNPIRFGTGRQFAFKQMVYGVLNMGLLCCMHYASYFYTKYDEKTSYKYIYVSLSSSLLFLIMQLQILIKF